MRNKSTEGKFLALLAGLVAIPAVGLAHPDDPKVLDRLPRYEGPGYRSGDPESPGAAQAGTFPSSGVNLLSWLSLVDFGSFIDANDCWGYVSPSGREYAIIGLRSATGFVEITDPANPVIIATPASPSSIWRDIKTYDQYAYAVSEGGSGIQVFDLTQIDSGTVTLANTITTGGVTSSHNVVIDTDSGFLYRCGGSSGLGLRFYDLATPSTPLNVGTWTDRYVHDAQVYTYSGGIYDGREIAFCCSGFGNGGTETGLDIVDVTDKGNPINISRLIYPGGAYSHQCWLSEDQQILYLNDELDENGGIFTTTHIINVSDIDNPVFIKSFTNASTAIGHNLYTMNSLIFEANYRSGLRIFEASDPLNPNEVAFFDTWVPDDNASFNGLWSTYPYFPSGTVIGSDIEKGLFMWELAFDFVSFSFPSGIPGSMLPATPTSVDVDITDFGSPLDPSSVTLNVSIDGAPDIQIPMADMGSFFQGDLPATNCGSTVEFYVSALNDNATVFVNPPNAPATRYQVDIITNVAQLVFDDFEAASGWTVNDGSDTATTGIWTQVDPVGTSAQPEDDHTTSGTQCWVTGQGTVGGGLGANDVDGGKTTLISQVYDLSGEADAVGSYYRWYSNGTGGDPNNDVFIIDISNDGGTNWTNVETVGPGGAEVGGGWILHEFTVSDFVAPTSQIQVRFIATDNGSGSIIEAAIDDFDITAPECVVATPPTITAAASVLTHGAAGDFVEPLVGGTIHETRLLGVTTLVVNFDMAMDPATTIAANISAIGLNSGAYGGSVGASLGGASDELTITFSPALTDVDRYTIDLVGMSSAAGSALVASTFEVIALSGDNDQNGVVSTGDASIIKPLFGTALDASNFGFDFNVDGVISTGDASQIKPRFGNTAP